MATTASGWPFVQPADHPVEFPASSQTLANLLESRVQSAAVAWTTVAPWQVFSGSALQITQIGKLVTLTGLVSPTSSQTLAAGAAVNIGSIPTAQRPITAQVGYATVLHSTAYAGGQAYVAAGTLQFIPVGTASITVPTSGFIGFNLSYRVA